jgi:hypothetical protein
MPSIVIEPDGTIDMRFTDEPVCRCCNNFMDRLTDEKRTEELEEGFDWPLGTVWVCFECQVASPDTDGNDQEVFAFFKGKHGPKTVSQGRI